MAAKPDEDGSPFQGIPAAIYCDGGPSGGVLSIVLAGHPKLRNALLRPNMEEIGFRFAVFPFEGMAGYQADYIAWLLGRCLKESTDQAGIIESSAVDLLATRLRTPLQIEQYLTLAFEETFRIGEKAVTAAVVEAVLSRQIDDLEPRLTRYGYDVKSIAEEFRVKLPRSACSCRASSTRRARAN